jgi:ElaB/YqjD/DUF883 family membrane-anchored ribosome-binding protein
MFGQQSTYSRAVSANVAEIERRLRDLERNLERVGSRTAASAGATADELRDTVASTLSSLIDRFRGSADAFSRDAAKFGDTATKAGGDALRRLTDEVEHRPLVMIAVAVGVGFLLGVATRR